MCKYCENMSIIGHRILQGKNISETYGNIFVECVQADEKEHYFISCDCHDGHHTESFDISFCPMCGRKLNEK